jgi:hypothetical protein
MTPATSIVAWISLFLSLFAVLLGAIGTYLMTSAYHPFKQWELFGSILDVLFRIVTLRWRSAMRIVRGVAQAGDELHKEKKDLSLLGINFLFASFFVQIISAAFAIWDAHKK